MSTAQTAALAAAALLGGAAGVMAQGVATAGESLPPGLEWELRTLDGRSLRLADLAGRPVVLNVWATWCLPCVAELRSFERLARSMDGSNVAFAMVAPQSREAVAEWVSRRDYALPFYVEADRMPRAFGLEAVPTTWVLDAAGRVVLKHRGAVDWDRDDVRELLRRLAAERAPGS